MITVFSLTVFVVPLHPIGISLQSPKPIDPKVNNFHVKIQDYPFKNFTYLNDISLICSLDQAFVFLVFPVVSILETANADCKGFMHILSFPILKGTQQCFSLKSIKAMKKSFISFASLLLKVRKIKLKNFDEVTTDLLHLLKVRPSEINIPKLFYHIL